MVSARFAAAFAAVGAALVSAQDAITVTAYSTHYETVMASACPATQSTASAPVASPSPSSVKPVAMPQNVTNGGSYWGTPSCPDFGPWMDGPMPSGFPWAGRNTSNSNPYKLSDVPNTGMLCYVSCLLHS